MVKLTEFMYVPQEFKNILILSRPASKGSMMGDTKYKITINKGGVSMTLYARKGRNDITMFYLKAERYDPEGSSPQETDKTLS